MRFTSVILALAVAAVVRPAFAGVLSVAGPTPFDPITNTGFKFAGVASVKASGIAIATANKYSDGTLLGSRAIQWSASGTTIEFANLGTSPIGYAEDAVYAANAAGTSAGFARLYVAGQDLGRRAVRWDATGVVTQLDTLSTSDTGVSSAAVYTLNSLGTAAGTAESYISGIDAGSRAVRWDAGTTTITELGNLGTSSSGVTYANVYAINTAGTAAGIAQKYVAGANVGYRAVRWDADATTAIELDGLGTLSDGSGDSRVNTISDAGIIIGYSRKYVNGVALGFRAVRWDPGATAVTELDSLYTGTTGVTFASAAAINDLGTIVGYCRKYAGNTDLGSRPMRWNAGSTTAIELPVLQTNSSGWTDAAASLVNNAGTAVGSAVAFVNDKISDQHALVWLPDNSVIDLNDLNIVSTPAGGTWVLYTVSSMNDDGWIAGAGEFDPDGSGPLARYSRPFVAQLGLGGNWLNTSGNNNAWGHGNNWSTGTPAIQLDATFNAIATYNVLLDKDQSCRNLSISGGHVTLLLGAHALIASHALTIAPGATLRTDGDGALCAASITLGGTPGSWSAKLDLAQAALILRAASPSEKAARLPTLLDQLQCGKATITGITSSSLSPDTTLALADNADLHYTTFRGQVVDDNSLLITQALFGDATLDNKVDALDLNLLAARWQQQTNALWSAGDFTGDGKVDALDLNLLAAHWQSGTSLESALASTGISDFQLSLPLSPIPEPASLGLLLPPLLFCRRRSHF